MLTKNQIKHISSLKTGKFRKEAGEFVAEGTKVVSELIASRLTVVGLYYTEEWKAKNSGFTFPFAAEEISEAVMERISQLTSPPGILAVSRIPRSKQLPKDGFKKLSLALDGINDPGNLGTIIRTAEWFGIRNIFCSPDTVEAYHPKVVQAAMGSLFRMNMHELPLAEVLQQAIKQDTTIYGAVLEGQNIYSQPLEIENALLLIGSESHGIRDYLLPFVKQKLTFPAYGRPAPESLNASVAAALMLAEFKRQAQKCDE